MKQKDVIKYLLGTGIIVLILLSGTTNLFAQSITLDSPNGDETWSVGTTQTISWTWTAIDDVKLYYSPDNFVAVTNTIASGLPISNTGNYEWTIPNDISPDFRFKVKVADASNPAVYDVSDNPFKIRADIVVTCPDAVFAGDPTYDDQSNEGEYPGLQWATSKLHDITWQITGTVPTILIECLENCITPTTVISPVDNTGIGSHEWEVFNFTSMADYQPVTATIRISDTRDISASAESDIFTICYYKIVWNLLDDVTSMDLNALSVNCPQSGWSESWISSPKTKYYPYGHYGPTRWMKTGYLETAKEEWWANADKSFTMKMESSVVHSWQVMADFNYNTTFDRLEVTSWFMRDGLIFTGPDSVSMDIYDQIGDFIKNLQSSTPDTNGVFRMNWDSPVLDPQQSYWVYITLTYAGKPFKSGLTFDIDSESGDIHSWQVMAYFNYNNSTDRLEVTSWLLRDGLILNNPDSVRIDIYDHSGTLIKILESSNHDSNGVFRMSWDNPGLDSYQTYSGYVTITYATNPYKGLLAHDFGTNTKEVIITGSSGDEEHEAWYKPQTWKCGCVGLEALVLIFIIGLLRRRKLIPLGQR